MKAVLARFTGRRAVAALAAVLAGLAAGLAHPPFGALPGLLGYAMFMRLVDEADPARPLRSAFWRGWLCGLGFFAVSVWWISEAFMVDIERHGWMAPFAISLLAAGLALFWGAAGALYRWAAPPGPFRVLVFAGALCLLEWLRGHVLTGFPWNLPGETWRAGSAPSQAASVVGAYGLSWITVAIAAAPALLLERPFRRSAAWAAGFAALGVAALYGYGAARLAGASEAHTGPLVRVVQPDIPQSIKYDEAAFRSIVDRYLTLTAQPGKQVPEIIVWPEGALPISFNDYMSPDTWTRPAIAAALRPGQTLLIGGYRLAGDPLDPIAYNSLFVVRREAQDVSLLAVYDKYRLVPFGEFTPLHDILVPMGVTRLVPLNEPFAEGPRPQPLAPPGMPPFQPLICYESLYPGFVRGGARKAARPPAWIVNISNDSWFGRTSGPWQHLNIASYRAIEEGLPMVRATPTGISAVIDAYGRIVPGGRLTHGKSGVIDAKLPSAAPPTLFRLWGELPFWLFIGMSFAVWLRHIVSSKNKA